MNNNLLGVRVQVTGLTTSKLWIPEWMHDRIIGAEGWIRYVLPNGAIIRFDKPLNTWSGRQIDWNDLRPLDDVDIYYWIMITKFDELGKD